MAYTISVIVPCYNVEKYLDRCVQSLLRQDIDILYRIILVDDGSTDNTASMVDHYASEFPDKVLSYHKRNGGLSSARNYGLDRIETEYVAFVDSDDFVSTTYLSDLYGSMIESNSDISMCGVKRVRSNTDNGVSFNTGFGGGNFSTNDILMVLRQTSSSATNKLYKFSLFDNIRFPEGLTFEDFATIPRVIYKARRISYVDRYDLFYFINPDSIINSLRKPQDKYNIFKAFEILHKSELSAEKELLEGLFVQKVVCSYVWELFSVSNSQTLISEMSDFAQNNFPHFTENYEIRNQVWLKRTFCRAFEHKRFLICKFIVKSFKCLSIIKQMLRNLR